MPVLEAVGEYVRGKVEHLIWAHAVIIDESYDDDEKKANWEDVDFQRFLHTPLTEKSLRVNVKQWILPSKAFSIEASLLLPYPQPRPRPSGRMGLPNPPVEVTDYAVKELNILYKKFSTPALDTVIRNTPPRPAVDIKVGHVYRLPKETSAEYINHAQSLSNWERPLGRPFLVVEISDADTEGDAIIKGFIITSSHNRTLMSCFPRNDRRTRWIRLQYLPIESTWAERHDQVPIVPLDFENGSAQFRERSYVYVFRTFEIPAKELLMFYTGERGIFFKETMVDGLRQYHGWLRREKRRRASGPHRRREADRDDSEFNEVMELACTDNFKAQHRRRNQERIWKEGPV